MQSPTHIRAMRFLGALAVLAIGAVHLQQYIGQNFRAIPTIGPLFLLNAIGSGVVGVALLVPVERVLRDRRAGDLVIAVLAMGGVAIALGSLVALLISETGSLFGFSESGYRAAVVIAIIAEAATIILLAPVAAVNTGRASSRGREHTPSVGSGPASAGRRSAA